MLELESDLDVLRSAVLQVDVDGASMLRHAVLLRFVRYIVLLPSLTLQRKVHLSFFE